MNITHPLPTIIDGIGEYETRAGERIKITSIGKFRHACRSYAKMDCIGTFPNGIQDRWNHMGFRTSGPSWVTGVPTESDHTIVKKIS
jgi:hypothetical protein